MASSTVLKLELLDHNNLYVEYRSPLRGGAYLLPLDTRLGNEEGRFHPGGHSFSASARNIVLKDNILHAKLRNSRGGWWNDELEIVVNISTTSTLVDFSIHFRRCDQLRLEECRNLRVIGQSLLAAKYLEPGGSAKDIYFDLNQFIGIHEGAFDRNGQWYSEAVHNAQIIGSTLNAVNTETGRQMSIDLSKILRLRDGRFQPLREPKTGELDCDVLTDFSNRNWLPNANNVRLISYKQLRVWYLVADCLNSRGWVQESCIQLHKIIGPHDEEMFSFFSDPSIPEHARKTSLDNGILTASFHVKDEDWVQRSFDLAELVTNEGGVLVKRKFGSECPRCSDLFYSGALYTPSSDSVVPLNGPRHPKTRHCTLCKLVDKVTKEYVPVCDSYETYILSRDRWKLLGRMKVIDKREVMIGIRAYGMKSKTRQVLYDWLVHGKQTIPQIIDIYCSILLHVGDENEMHEKDVDDNDIALSRPPRRYRTIPRNTYDRCWLDPSLRWSTIQSWITKCQSEHDTCTNTTSPQLPTRYLHVGTRESDPIRLVVSNGERGAYACLSHCWGGSQPCTLTEKTKPQYTKAIPRSVFPPVFHDAIKVCRKLGLKRLWIDSLCIQQDSKDDWQHESQKMGPYYLNCTICIAATSSANSSTSFEIAERPTLVSSSGVDSESGPFSLFAYPFDLMEERPHFGRSDEMETLIQSFPLLTRGWVLQERWLSPRVLHFCGTEVVFECAQMTTCECGQAREGFALQWRKFSNIRATTTSTEGLVTARSQLATIDWDRLVTTYSYLRLTYSTDRLVAISGLASTLYNVRHKPYEGLASGGIPIYLAGLWRTRLVKDMAWFVGPTLIFSREEDAKAEAVATERVRKSRPTTYVAPTWSWASIIDPVRYFLWGEMDPLFTLLDAQINLATDDAFGALEEGCYLHLRGKTLRTSWELKTDNHNVSVYHLKDVVGTQLLGNADRRGINFSPDYAIAKPGPNQLDPANMLYIFPLAKIGLNYTITTSDVDEEITNQSESTLCLVLRALEGYPGKKNVYERIGFTEYTNYQNGIRNVDPNGYTEEELYII